MRSRRVASQSLCDVWHWHWHRSRDLMKRRCALADGDWRPATRNERQLLYCFHHPGRRETRAFSQQIVAIRRAALCSALLCSPEHNLRPTSRASLIASRISLLCTAALTHPLVRAAQPPPTCIDLIGGRSALLCTELLSTRSSGTAELQHSIRMQKEAIFVRQDDVST